MNPEIKAKWVAELRSGKYEQGAFKLNSAGKFCCLGVLCEIARDAGIVDAISTGTHYSYVDATTDAMDQYQWEDTILPRAVSAWAGLETGSPDVFVDPDQTRRRPLTTINDSGKSSFAEIANMIEGSL